MKKKREQKLWLLVLSTTLVIFLLWAFTLKYSWHSVKTNPFIGPEFSKVSENWKQVRKTWQELIKTLDEEKTNQIEELVERTPQKKVIANPNNLSEEKIKELEKKIFPEKNVNHESKESKDMNE